MDRWDVFIILVAGYVAVMTLVRLMARRRSQMMGYVREQIADQLSKKKKNAGQAKSNDQSAKKDRGAA